MLVPENPSARSGSTTGFDVLRLTLSTLILWSRCSWIQYLNAFGPGQRYFLESAANNQEFRSFFRTLTAMTVPMFFVLSGYLVAGSAERLENVRIFLIHRVLRIGPALIVEVTLSALIIGSIFTKLPLIDYFTNRLFYEYLLNTVGMVHFYLPGVFEDSRPPRYVNINLWTLPAEFYCYLLMTLCMIMRFHKHRRALLFATMLVYFGFISSNMALGSSITNGENFRIRFMVLFFSFGMCFYLYRVEIVMNRWIFTFAFLIGFGFLSCHATLVLSPLSITYATIFLGTRKPYLPEFFKRNDYSYGIYLYGFPIAQSLSAAFPKLRGARYTYRVVVVVVTAVFAALSWHLVEKRCLGLKPRVAGPPPARPPPLARERSRLDDRFGEIRAAQARGDVRPFGFR